MKTHSASRAFNQAIKRDNEWFRANPAARFRRRHVDGAELPRAMRGHGIRTVVIERAGPATFLRTYFDNQEKPLFSGCDFYDDQIGPSGPTYPISIRHDGGAIQEMIVNREDVALADRELFEQHPGEREFTRPSTEEEIRHAAGPYADPNQWCGVTTVKQIGPGFRTRRVELRRKKKAG